MTHPEVYTIPPHRAFADALAAGLLAKHKDPLELARGIVLVPTNRAARAIQDGFVRRAESGLLLPRLVPIGDPEIGESLGAALDPIGGGEPVPPAIDPLQRTMRLAALVQQVRARHGDPIDAGEAVRLARDLAATLDALLIERVDPSRLKHCVEEELQDHWKLSLEQLETILDRWPEDLEKLGKIDMAERRNRLLGHVAKRWADRPPPGFVVAAGIATTAPAIAGVLRTVARMPKGTVVLPALDLDMPGEEWEALGPFEPDPETGKRKRAIETHPQYALKLLLDRIGVARAEVERWRWGGGHDSPAVRSRAISNAMAPAQFTGKWNELPPRERRLTGVRALELATPAEEAQVIALALREAIEEPGRTAALVTPDRQLARRVSAHLARWGIAADRGPHAPKLRPETRAWWAETARLLAPLEKLAGDWASAIAAIRETATALAGDAAWSGMAGRRAAEFIADLEMRAAEGPGDTELADLPMLFEQLMAEIAIRPAQGGHPRISIWGSLEARLQQADLMVLGGLNEGTWPGLPQPDPWLAPRLRAELGLPGLERRIGLSAHDLASALGGRQVLVTR
ncbi:MAG: double-strand break repair protein AddB, partial [Parasphingopyxis sp.]